MVAPSAAEMAERSAPQHATAAMRESPLICAVLLSDGIMLLAAAAEKNAASAQTPRAIGDRERSDELRWGIYNPRNPASPTYASTRAAHTEPNT